MDELREVEDNLRLDLRHLPAPEGFTDRVMQRVADRQGGRTVHTSHETTHRRIVTAGQGRTAWWTAIAAAFALAIGGGDLLHIRHQRQVQQAAAQAQVDLAMQVTSHALDAVEIGLDRSAAGRFTKIFNDSQR